MSTLSPSEPKVSASSSAEQLERAAYFAWLNRGCPVGDDWADWFAAERGTQPSSKSASAAKQSAAGTQLAQTKVPVESTFSKIPRTGSTTTAPKSLPARATARQ